MLHYLPCRAAAINSGKELGNPSGKGMGMVGINTRLDVRGPPGPTRAFANPVPHFLYSLLFTFFLGPGCCLISFGSYGLSPNNQCLCIRLHRAADPTGMSLGQSIPAPAGR